MIRQILGNGDGEIVGCTVCGEVQHLINNETHHCNSGSTPFAVTLEAELLIHAPLTESL